ncbi:MAG: hypothetical protein GXP45_07540 [bacterium]|nr:hypothetical protein [bacterium]
MPFNLASDVKSKFADFEHISGGDVDEKGNVIRSEQEKRKAVLQDIVNTIAASVAQ